MHPFGIVALIYICMLTDDEIKIHILRQDKKNVNIKFFFAHLSLLLSL